MVTEKEILSIWKHVRKTNNSIPDEAIDFVRDAALEKLKEKTNKNKNLQTVTIQHEHTSRK